MKKIKNYLLLLFMSVSPLWASQQQGWPVEQGQGYAQPPVPPVPQYVQPYTPPGYHYPSGQTISTQPFVTVNVSPEEFTLLQNKVNILSALAEEQKVLNEETQNQLLLYKNILERLTQLETTTTTTTNVCNGMQSTLSSQQSQIAVLLQQIAQNGQKNSVININNSGGIQTTSTAVNSQVEIATMTDSSAPFYYTLVSPKSLMSAIIVLVALAKEGPAGAMLATTVLSGLFFCTSAQAFERFKRKIKVGVTGISIATIAAIVGITSRDKELATFAAVGVPITVLVTGAMLAAE